MSNQNNMFMAMSTGLLNAAGLVVVAIIPSPDAKPIVMSLVSLLSPFLSLSLLKLWIKADDPPELTRKITGLKSSIKICKKDLQDPDATDDFKLATRLRMQEFQRMLQEARSISGGSPDYALPPVEPP